MLIFGLDTSGSSLGVSIVEDDVVKFEAVVKNKMTHSENILPLTNEAFSYLKLSPSDIDCYALTVGPGSFTGVRIGVSFVKGMANAHNTLCYPINALYALAKNIGFFDGVICAIQDARRGQVYCAMFDGTADEQLLQNDALKLEDFIQKAVDMESQKPMLFVGDGVPVYKQKIQEILKDRAKFPPAHMQYVRPCVLALMAQKDKQNAVFAKDVHPLYLRAPQAERERNMRLLGHE